MLIIFDQATFSDNLGLQIMTVMLNLPPEKEARLIAAAQAKGLSTDALVREALDRILAEGPAPAGLPRSLQDELTPEGWVRQFDAWVDSHDRTTPLFSDEAISRESIYPDRFSLCWSIPVCWSARCNRTTSFVCREIFDGIPALVKFPHPGYRGPNLTSASP